MNTLFASLQPPLEGRGEVVFAQRSDDPLPPLLELVLGAPSSAQETRRSRQGPGQESRGGGEEAGSTFRPKTPGLSARNEPACCPNGGTIPQGPGQAFSPSKPSKTSEGQG